ncbi:hypothetical protein QJS10_CPA05g02180 [Acorus calamus]|uniref:Uncharacterized protein n=1 Tax=Acorus calamus TaxID=4465 RepID=A0AAV9ETB8_ACOCL|nr:hypothetical protein QJS10_CPA05g02180 [Acorus calamus]
MPDATPSSDLPFEKIEEGHGKGETTVVEEQKKKKKPIYFESSNDHPRSSRSNARILSLIGQVSPRPRNFGMGRLFGGGELTDTDPANKTADSEPSDRRSTEAGEMIDGDGSRLTEAIFLEWPSVLRSTARAAFCGFSPRRRIRTFSMTRLDEGGFATIGSPPLLDGADLLRRGLRRVGSYERRATVAAIDF